MTGLETFGAVLALSFTLQATCDPAGPEDPAHWDYDCGIVVVRPLPGEPPEPPQDRPAPSR